ncbi:MAG: hypothetical protein ABIQ99_02950 [Thermoflexales bacterium]
MRSKHDRNWRSSPALSIALALALCATLGVTLGAIASLPSSQVVAPPSAPEAVYSGPTNSSPIAMTNDKLFVWTVNSSDDSVYVINAATNALVSRITVGDDPQSVAIDPNSEYAYVANAADNTVSVIHITGGGAGGNLEANLVTGAEPWNVVISPDGKRVYVANSVQDTISIIKSDVFFPTLPNVIGNVELTSSACNTDNPNRHFQPRGLAVTADNTKLYVTRFLSMVKTGGTQATDGGKEGLVCRLSINTSAATKGSSVTAFVPIKLPATNTGFKDKNGGDTFAYANQMQSIVLRGASAFAPNIAASAGGPLKFNNDTQAYVNIITGTNAAEAAAGALNLHLGARVPEFGRKKLFFANVWSMAFTSQSGAGTGYVVASASDLLVKVNIDASDRITFTAGVSTTRYVDLNDPNALVSAAANAGKNPVGIVIGAPGNVGVPKAFVLNFVSRNVLVVDTTTDAVIATIALQALPAPGSVAEQRLVGAEMFFSSRGHFVRPGGTTVPTDERLSSEGWQACSSCHFNGWTDGEIWSFNTGPRKSVPLNGTWSPHNPDDQRLLNYSAIFDEVQDFELNIRNVSGPGPISPTINGSSFDPSHGLLISDTPLTGNINAAPLVVNTFAKPNAGRPQLKVILPGSSTEWPALDALKEWVRNEIRTPNGALTVAEMSAPGLGKTPNPDTAGGIPNADAIQGRRLFFQAGCGTCHAGPKWTLSRKDFAAPPIATDIFTEAPVTTTVGAQYLNRFLRDVKSFNLNVVGAGNTITGQAEIGGIEKIENGVTGALGKDVNGDGKGSGYNVPSLLGIFNLPPYYHNGACETLACVLANPNHRASGLAIGQADPLATPGQQAKVVAWLKTLDAQTLFPVNLRVARHDIFLDPPTVFAGTQITIGANVGLFGQKQDLADMIADLGITATLRGRITFNGQTQVFSITAAHFDQNFGKATYSKVFTAPATPGIQQVAVTIDADNVLPTAAGDETADNAASRYIRVRAQPPDNTPPKVLSIFLSDEVVFNDVDAIVTTTTLKIKINAQDLIGPNLATPSGLKQFCVVRYYYSLSLRRWVENPCVFQDLPAPTAGDVFSGTFIVNAQIPDFAGTAYAFAWVKDTAGNISRTPGFDVVSYIPAGEISVTRNDTRIFRVLTPASQTVTFTVGIVSGDVDVSAFDGVGVGSTRVAVSANNGTVTETVTVTNNTASSKLFQIEVRAVANSVIKVGTQQTGALLAEFSAADMDVTAPEVPAKDDSDEMTISGPPALQTAIGDDAETTTYLPLIIN